MLHITSLNEGLELFKALGSDVRIEILNILLENDNMSMNELASRLNITNGALTSHIKKLENCGLSQHPVNLLFTATRKSVPSTWIRS